MPPTRRPVPKRPTSPYTAAASNPFTSFGSKSNNDIDVRDRKHMSIIDNPASLSPGGNTARKHNSTYRLSDILSTYDGPESESEKAGSEGQESERAGLKGDEGSDHSDAESDGEGSGSESEKQEDPFKDDASSDGHVSDDENASEGSKTPGSGSEAGSESPNGEPSPNCSTASSAKHSAQSGSEHDTESGYASDQSSIAQSITSAADSDSENSGDSDSSSEHSSTSSAKATSRDESASVRRRNRRHSIVTNSSDVDNDSAGTRDQHCFSPLPLNQENLALGLSWLWQTSAFSDLTISCSHYNFPVHKCIVAAQCRDLAALLRRKATSANPSGGEGKTVLELHDDHPEALKTMLQYLYTGALVVPTAAVMVLGGAEVASVDILLKVYELGCKYSLPLLKAEAARQYIHVLSCSTPRGNALWLAKLLVTISRMVEKAEAAKAAEVREEWFVEGATELKEVTLQAAVESAEELFNDAVAFDLVEGEPMRELVGRVLRKNRRRGVEREVAKADFERADFERADFERADFERADFERADLERADLERAELMSPKSSPAVPATPVSACSMEGFWR